MFGKFINISLLSIHMLHGNVFSFHCYFGLKFTDEIFGWSVMYVIDLRRAMYYQKCHDPECRGQHNILFDSKLLI